MKETGGGHDSALGGADGETWDRQLSESPLAAETWGHSLQVLMAQVDS